MSATEAVTTAERARTGLAARQRALVEALAGRAAPPAGFDHTRLEVAIEQLATKRRSAVARAWPALARSLGPEFPALFARYAAQRGLPRDGGPLADGRAFTGWLLDLGSLPEAGRIEALVVDLLWRHCDAGLVRRRGPACRTVWLRESRALVLGLAFPGLGARWWCIGLTAGGHRD